jgi:zinc/manganese transport system substrate-binding protein
MTRKFYTKAALLAVWLAGALSAQAGLRVAALHPLLTDLARQVGGDHVTVLAIAKPGTDMHHFSPSPRDMQELSGADLVLASGKKLENYLGKLRDNLTKGQILIEVGDTIPSMEMNEAMAMLEAPEAGKDGQEGHVHGGVDPHWWNSVENMQRAVRSVAAAFAKADPEHAAAYQANADDYGKRLTDLKKWARLEIARIPAGERKLATSHLALSYFAAEFGFRLIPVQGLNPEVPATSKDLARAIDTIRRSKVRAVFPEQGVNPKLLEQIAAETGVAFGGELIADGNGTGPLATFTGAFEHNIREITKALAPVP